MSNPIDAAKDAVTDEIQHLLPGPLGGMLSGLILDGLTKTAHGLEVSTLSRIWVAKSHIIAQNMLAEGWTTDKPAKTKSRTAANAGNPNNTIAEIIRDAQFRLWRKVFAVPEGGIAADQFRDKHEAKVLALLQPELQEHNITAIVDIDTLELIVSSVAEAELDITF